VKRIENPNHARFLTFSCYHRLPLFSNDAIKDAFADQLRRTRSRHEFNLYAWVLMPEHIHLLIRCHAEATARDVLGTLKTGFAKRVIARWRELDAPVLDRIKDQDGQLRFWQRGGGYDRNLMMGRELLGKFDYIHSNPVRRGLVDRPEDWAWSSARWWSGQRNGEIGCDALTVSE
jgi:putative transposase